MECHRCPYNGKHDDHCLTCTPSDSLTKRGQTFVSIDAAEDGADAFLNHRKNRRDVTPADEAELDDSPGGGDEAPDGIARQLDKEDALRKVAATIFELTPQDFELVKAVHDMGVGSLSWLAMERGVTRQNVWERLQKIKAKHPAIGVMLDACLSGDN